MRENRYLKRTIDAQIAEALEVFGGVCIEGPKWCGKTWAALNAAKSVFYVGDPAGNFQNRRLAEIDPTVALTGEKPHLIDEWQEVPSLWDAVRFDVDQAQGKGSYLLSGSSVPVQRGVMHTGTGRICIIRMHPMSLAESGDSSAQVSLACLFGGDLKARQTGNVELSTLARLIVRGGWPGNLQVSAAKSGAAPRAYIEQVAERDASRLDNKSRDPHKMMMLLRSLARNESTLASMATLRRDIQEYDDDDVSDNTVAEYLTVLNRIFAVYEQPAFNPHMRSSVRVGKKPKRHLADPSLAAAALRVTPERLMGDLETFGFLFEALCERDLNIYAQALGGSLYHYRDALNREIDAVVELPDGRWGAFEIKLGANQIDGAAAGLLALKKDMEEDQSAIPPSILVVICGMSSFAYTRPDGVMVVPITALGV